jgi:hypothetical protein
MRKITILIFLVSGLLAYAPTYVGACLAANGSAWINCTTYTNSTPVNNIINTIQGNAPWAFTFYYFAIYISIALFLLVQDRSLSRFNFITFLGMILAIVFEQYQLLPPSVMAISVSLFALSVVANIFWK